MGEAAKKELQTRESAHAKATACLALDQAAECHRSLISCFETSSGFELYRPQGFAPTGWSRKRPEHEAVLKPSKRDSMLTTTGLSARTNWLKDEKSVDRLLAGADANGDGSLQIEEFVRWISEEDVATPVPT